jgi:hypothetical protein
MLGVGSLGKYGDELPHAKLLRVCADNCFERTRCDKLARALRLQSIIEDDAHRDLRRRRARILEPVPQARRECLALLKNRGAIARISKPPLSWRLRFSVRQLCIQIFQFLGRAAKRALVEG